MSDLAALYKHWCIADSVKQFAGATVPGSGESALPPDELALVQAHSSFMRLSVWYALLQVVVEGYNELGISDPAMDSYLADEEYTQALRRFRNAMFHYQENPFSAKLLGFLELDNGEWARCLNAPFKRYFERNLPINKILEHLENA
ncbi:hypothetical protein [Halomonas sp. YLGW01]|uniref:hypothetical protein n=1 Tax=Halomonas sp. YLGW01 TaxID=2773308 RepID=UPI00177A7D02|nr:hypothetical protein [Halomonas sp. YLGW01]